MPHESASPPPPKAPRTHQLGFLGPWVPMGAPLLPPWTRLDSVFKKLVGYIINHSVTFLYFIWLRFYMTRSSVPCVIVNGLKFLKKRHTSSKGVTRRSFCCWCSRSISPDGKHTNRRIRHRRVKAFLPKDEAMVAMRRDRSGSVNYLEEDD